ncbi:uncharacterized protein LOC106461004 [Limulus polyphemus]|uniref:Uncharacterized protein LOC106461004 n=1 Tax=Limulus polyphemus TaxID=6850 RepID=A0ABM1B788_LIMPO|nr:uncharacterized protein LOC106461004 [Limulus polyphemus]
MAIVIQPAYFLRESTRRSSMIKNRTLPTLGILDDTSDWDVAVGIVDMRQYPEVIARTSFRPDLVLYSESTRTIVAIELTVPYKTRMSESHEYKLANYEKSMKVIQDKGYITRLFAVELGARGMTGSLLYSLLKHIGLSSQRKSKYLKELAKTEGGMLDIGKEE